MGSKKAKPPPGESPGTNARLRQSFEPADLSEHEARRLLNELQVHRIELQLQNEELKKTRMAAEAGLARYTELFEFAPIGYATLAEDGTIHEVNHAGARLLETERSRLVGRRFADLILAAQLQSFSQMLRRVHAGQVREACEVALWHHRRGRIGLRLSAVMLAHAHEDNRTVLLAFEDITERIQREEKLAATEHALREADRRKDDFLAALSHELRNPLAPIRNSLFVLARVQHGSDRASEAHAVVDRQVTHLARLVDDLLDVTRIARGKVQLRRMPLELGELVRSTMEDHRSTFEASGLWLDAHLNPGPFWIDADAARIVQVLSNLLGNAEKFTPRGGSVLVSLYRLGSTVALRVSDTGVGIAADVLQHLFEPFSQARETMDRSRGGLGLGLAMTKGLVELHGGSIGIASDGHGRGTTVTVTLPLEDAPAVDAEAAAPRVARPRRVLVIDDSQDSANMLKLALVLNGHQAEAAYDGPHAIALARKLRPEVIICDIGLPHMDGYEVARILRADDALKDVYLIALTGYAMSDDLERAFAAGFNQHVSKPPPLETLNVLISEAPGQPAAPKPKA